MKTQAITILAFAGAGLAQERSNVHIGTEVNFTTNNGGFQSNPEITINQCCTLPPFLHRRVFLLLTKKQLSQPTPRVLVGTYRHLAQ